MVYGILTLYLPASYLLTLQSDHLRLSQHNHLIRDTTGRGLVDPPNPQIVELQTTGNKVDLSALQIVRVLEGHVEVVEVVKALEGSIEMMTLQLLVKLLVLNRIINQVL